MVLAARGWWNNRTPAHTINYQHPTVPQLRTLSRISVLHLQLCAFQCQEPSSPLQHGSGKRRTRRSSRGRELVQVRVGNEHAGSPLSVHTTPPPSPSSRQLYTLGVKAQSKVGGATVLISGLGGLGVEIAKNVILAGVKSVTLVDDKATTLRDLGTQFFLTAEDVGKPRAEACAASLQELNGYVSVATAKGPVSQELVAAHSIVVMTDAHAEELQAVNGFARASGVRSVPLTTPNPQRHATPPAPQPPRRASSSQAAHWAPSCMVLRIWGTHS